MSQSDSPTSAAPRPRRVRVHHLREMKEAGEKITMLTAYDYPTALIMDRAGIDMLLVGDSYGTTMLGYDTTIPVTVDELVVATRSVSRAVERAMVVADLPFGSYEQSPAQCLATSARLLKEGGANAVKFEGGRQVAEHVAACTRFGIPVVGHLGFTPQAENTLGGKRVQGRGDGAVERLTEDALALQEAGACAVVLEMVPSPAAAAVTQALTVPTIGIGAGVDCDGQVLVWTDMAGLGDWAPRFSKRFGEVGAELTRAVEAYRDEVRSGTFPDAERSFEA
ncbi:MAG TPA: 3-methyl-2-oxobutanoate hydroxymethyltransferase [Actinomycetales bacterium]|nr:3-methyl-2-oxobutanoate hydroxymethyltransferase [Actinomycetales bacterium]